MKTYIIINDRYAADPIAATINDLQQLAAENGWIVEFTETFRGDADVILDDTGAIVGVAPRGSTAAAALGSITSDAKAASSRANGRKGGRPRNITESWLQSWVDTHRPGLGLHETNDIKGFYKLDAGPAHSFMGIGKTWKQVAAHLEAIKTEDKV